MTRLVSARFTACAFAIILIMSCSGPGGSADQASDAATPPQETGPQLLSSFDPELGIDGKEIHVRRSSSYFESLNDLNRDLIRRGLDPIRIIAAEEYLEDEDLLEMVNAGLLPMVVVDSHKARFWAGVLDGIRVREDLVVRSGAQIAWAF